MIGDVSREAIPIFYHLALGALGLRKPGGMGSVVRVVEGVLLPSAIFGFYTERYLVVRKGSLSGGPAVQSCKP